MSEKIESYFSGDNLAANVWFDKYCLKDRNGVPVEETPADMHWRMAKEFARIEYGYIRTEVVKVKSLPLQPLNANLSDFGKQLYSKRFFQTKQDIEQEFFNYFNKFGQIVPQGSIMSNLGNFFVYGSLSNCFTVPPPYDSYSGIMKTDEHIAQIEKRRGGVGTRIDTLRPTDALVSNSAKSSTGITSFCERFSNTTREVAQGGRRGALMLLCNVKHPDIFRFASMKDDRTKVTGANVSIMFTDEFMEALEDDNDFICRFPIDADLSVFDDLANSILTYNTIITASKGNFTCSVMKIKPKELFDLVVEMAHKNAEPGVAFINTIQDYCPEGVYSQYIPSVSNPCVIGETEILTDNGYKRIDSLVEQEVNIWNGFVWSKVTPKITGQNQHTLKITLSDGRSLTCTDYHKWYTAIGYSGKREMKIASDLKIGDKIIKYNFPIIKDGETVELREAYTQGFISADGQDNYDFLYLYEPKYMCLSNLDGSAGEEYTGNTGTKRRIVRLNRPYLEKSFIPYSWNLEAKLAWLSGLFDGDGTELKEGGFQLVSIDLNFLEELQKLLSLLGINSKVVDAKEEGMKSMPDGKGGYKDYLCQKNWRILIGSVQMQELKELGLSCNRMSFNKTPQRDATQFVKVVAIEDTGYADTVYCFNEPKSHLGVFNGIITGQCSEIWMTPYDACRLIASNLWSMVINHFEKNAYIDYDKVYEIFYIQQRLGDNLVDLECEYIDRIIDKIKADPEPLEIKEVELNLWIKIQKIAREGRRTGGGFTALGDMLAALNLKYDSDEAIATVEKVMKTKMRAELDCTIDMAILRGTFVGWDKDLEFKQDIDLHSGENTNLIGQNSFFKILFAEFPNQAMRMYKWGRRNTNFSTVAPTGSVSILTQSTSGLEPLFKAYYIRRKKINPSEQGVRIDFTDQSGDTWQEFAVLHPKFKEWIENYGAKVLPVENDDEDIFTKYPYLDEVEVRIEDVGILDIKEYVTEPENFSKETIKYFFEQSPWYKSEADDISWEKRIEMQAIIQKYTSNAISSTINLPKDVKLDVVKGIYLAAYKAGLKGVTVYRDGSRSGVLVTESAKAVVDKFGYTDAIKRPKELEAHYHTVTVRGKLFAVVIGLFEGIPYELFAIEEPVREGEITGKIIKKNRGEYMFKSPNLDIANLQLTSEHTDEKLLTRMCSQLLRHGVNPKHIVEQVEKSEVTVVSFAKAIVRVLKRYIPDGVTGQVCKVCNEPTVIYEEGCRKCVNCGDSRC